MLTKDRKAIIFRILYLIFFILLSVVLISLLKDFNKSLNFIKHSNKTYLCLVLFLSFTNFILAAYSYMKLSFFPQGIIKSTIVQFAANTMNKILPAGIGALGTLYDFMIKSKNTKTQALALVAINNILGLVAGILTLLTLVFIGKFNSFSKLHLNFRSSIYILIAFLLSLVIWVILYFKVKKIRIFFKDLGNQFLAFKSRKSNLLIAFMAQILLNLSNVLCLYLTTRALGFNFNISDVAITYNLAILIGNLIPAPGGVGSVDAGLIAILVVFGASISEATSISILFRILNMWTPFVLGLPAIFYARKKKYI